MKLVTALATPYRSGKVDVNSYVKLLETQKNVDALLCCGTTAECAFLSECEKKLLVKLAKSLAPNAEIWVGVASSVTSDAVKEGIAAKNLGADGLLISPPSFSKCTQDGFEEHVKNIRRATDLPIMLYNAPSRCGYVLWRDSVEKLANEGVISEIKDAGSDLEYTEKLSQSLPVYCGNEELLAPSLTHGATGVVSVVSNAAPQLVKKVMELSNSAALTACEISTAATFEKLAKLVFCQLNPIPIKYLLYKLGIFASCEMRLPLTPANTETRRAIDEFADKFRNEIM